MSFTLLHTDGSARAGLLQTGHGEVRTPVFMPVGTQGTVKAVEQRELEEIGAQIILGNTYHLYLRPGTALLETMGGLHGFMAWRRPVLTDSGGYQVFSLADLRGITEEGVDFTSHLDGSAHRFTPERVVDIQRSLGSDVMMVLDECVAYPAEESYTRASSELTLRWAERCRAAFERTRPLYGHPQLLFGIVQGGTFPELRRRSAEALAGMAFDGYAIGGLSVGEPAPVMEEITALCTGLLPEAKPRYLMGVGTPENILAAIERGVDMFDCVLPTRNGRNAVVFTRRGRLNLRNARHAVDPAPLDADCGCYTCRTFSRAYLRHLFKAGEILALQLATIHNLTEYMRLTAEARGAILEGRFGPWKEEQLRRLRGGDEPDTTNDDNDTSGRIA